MATLLSFVWPGLGQAYAGRRQAAGVFALPLVVIALLLLATAIGSVGRLASLLIQPSSALTVTIVILLAGAWRITAMGEAMTGLLVAGSVARRRALMIFALLTAIVIGTHGWLAYVTWSFYDAGRRAFVTDVPDPTVAPSLAPGVSGPPPTVGITPSPTPLPRSSRVSILLLGIDSTALNEHALTDTMIVVSVLPETGEIAMVSFPRDLADFPLVGGGTYHAKINSLMTYARQHPTQFPDGPHGTLTRELGNLLGVPIQYYASVDLAGFRKVIDVAGGVTIDNQKLLDDPTYAWAGSSRRGFRLTVGRHHLDGETALAYVRSRKSAGDTDFARSRRQQQVLLALRAALVDPDMLARLPDLAQAVGDTIRTNIPSDRVADLIDLTQGLDGDAVTGVVLGPPYALQARGPGIFDYRLRFDEERLARKSVELFGDDSRYATP
ncbi:MAG: LCP family protein [Candidatus Limnocylindrales bacterium]